MARLLVYRGDKVDRELEITRLPVKIGRSATNDLVLEDPLKSVSREHAEIRIAGPSFVLVDLHSENGIWSGGHRLTTVTFDPTTIASIGPFRLKIEGTPDATVIVSERTTAPTAPLESVAPTPQTQTARIPSEAAAPRVTAPAVRKPTAQRTWMLGGTAAVVAVAALVGTAVFVRSARRSDEAARAIASRIAAANAQVSQGACADALAQNIQPGLAQDPNNVDLLNLKQRAESCLKPPTPPTDPQPPLSPTAVALNAAREKIEQGTCDAALRDEINGVLLAEPDNAEAQDLKARAEKCIAAAAVTTIVEPRIKTPPLAQVVPAENGGLEPLPGELDRDYQTRIKAMRARYDEAVATAASGATRRAINAFESIIRDATPRYLDVATKLADARRAFRAAAQRTLAEARELEEKQMWNQALEKYKQASEADPSLSIDADLNRINQAKIEAGRRICTQARQRINYNQPDARDLYNQVLQLLGPEEPCYAEAKRILGVR